MGMCMSGGIFQAKIYEILHYIEVFKTYIDDIMVLNKDGFPIHIIEQLKVILDRIWRSGLKVNTPKFVFGLKYMHCLVYVITQEGIKNDRRKVQGIMDIVCPNTTTELLALIGMVN